MRVHLQREVCSQCMRCLAKCPEKLTALESISCLHCSQEEAACKGACPRNAFYEVAKGILKIDEGKCNGCGLCREACPVGSIEIAGKKARKCTLCAADEFRQACISACGKKALSKAGNEKEEKNAAENILGWGCLKVKGREISTKGERSLIKEEGEAVYCLNLPNLSKQEAELVKDIRDEILEHGKKLTLAVVEEYCLRNLIDLDDEQKDYIVKLLELLSKGMGPVAKLIEDDDLEEIALIGIGKERPLYVYLRDSGWLKTNIYYAAEEEAVNAINAMARSIGKRITLQKPKLNAVLDNGSRLSASIQPIAINGAAFTVRKFRAKPFTPSELVRKGTISGEAAAFLWMALQSEVSILVVGNTGSGKTTTLNALFSFVPQDERIVIVEETPEINIAHKHKVKITTNEELKITMEDLITETLRMRPDRIVVGEVRSKEEIRAFVDTLLAGQGRGSFATFHAQSAKEAITRMKSKGIEEIDLASLDLLIVQRRWVSYSGKNKSELRKVTEIAEINESESGIKVSGLYSYDFGKGCLAKTGKSTRAFDRIGRSFGLGEEEIEGEIAARADFLGKAAKKEMGFEEFSKAVLAYGTRN